MNEDLVRFVSTRKTKRAVCCLDRFIQDTSAQTNEEDPEDETDGEDG